MAAQPGMMTPIPADEAVRTGKLENGMTYYIRHNEKPKGQADFYILHDVGAIQENDDQQGLAHFLEHMAFNGTKNLPGKMLTEYLETVGVKFGYNLNASTGWDQTTYQIKDVPTLREGVIDSALLILHDWSHFIALEGDEIDSERGVICEELRTRDGAQWRSMMAMIKALGKGTKYEHRNLIGYLDYLKSFDHQVLRDFYHQWYRPDYQAVIVVGDVDVDAIEAKVKTLMSD
ncbi:MAG: insulinase family protein, partial [Alistipes sp.]|nr:insulinase family protein [Alistipes sp.]